jgi:hypothetical protein
MAALNDKFDVLRGWEPGGDAGIDQSFPPDSSGGTPVALMPGNIVTLKTTGEVEPGTTGAATQRAYIVVEGNVDDYSAQFVNKVVCLRGKLTVKTDKLDGGSAFPVTGPLTYDTGVLRDWAAGEQQIGIVIANNVAVDGTIVAELDL